MRKISKFQIAVAAIVLVLTLILTGSIAFANDTPSVCDSVPKYYCTTVNYDPNALGGWNINHRYYIGATDGGADRWQLWYAADWYWNGSQWVLQTNWGSSGWYTNVYFDVAHEQGSAVSIAYYGAVTMRTRYHEPVSDTFWCSEKMEHDLWTGQSLQYGTGVC